MGFEASHNSKDRQSLKIKELSAALVEAGFSSLDEQANALGLPRSTTWTILRAKHKNYGLSAAVVRRILHKPGLNRRVRAKVVEYVQEKVAGSYGHNKIQLRRFTEHLSFELSSADVHHSVRGKSNRVRKRRSGLAKKNGRQDDLEP